ncbi:Outer membrane protein OprM [Gallionellaceae bacterium]|nr:Outer membrane protein OprM [Gallionellaceae bacterium]
MWRYYSALAALLLECLWLAWPLNAAGSNDPFGTEKYVVTGQFARSSDAALCPKDRIQKPLALADVVDLTLCNNPQTRSLWASARAQAAQLGSSMSSYLPTLSGPVSISGSSNKIGGTTTDSTQGNIGVTASYLLYDFGGRDASVENAKQLLMAVNATRDETLQGNFLAAVQSYYALLSARASVQSFQAAEDAAKKSLDAAQARYKAGTATLADRLQAQTALSQAVLNHIRAMGDVATAQGTLANIMGFDANQPFELAPAQEPRLDSVAERDIGKLIADARQSRPDLLAADAQIKAAEAQLAATKSSGLPTITLDGGVSLAQSRGSGVDGTTRNGNVGVTVRVPWFSGYRDTYQNRVAQAQLEGKVAERDRVANQIALDVWKAYQGLLTNSQALRAADDLMASAEQSEKVASGRYQAGVGSILDALTAQSALASARQQRVAALYTFQASKFTLAQSIGQLDLTLIGTNNPVRNE